MVTDGDVITKKIERGAKRARAERGRNTDQMTGSFRANVRNNDPDDKS